MASPSTSRGGDLEAQRVVSKPHRTSYHFHSEMAVVVTLLKRPQF